jgi:TetR/AcrR family transcriptional regulator, lmrAB and yxaGH operons repressor
MPATDTRGRFLQTAVRLLHQRGYEGMSLNELIAESGAPRGSLYHHFPGGKDQLVREATLHGIAQVDAFLRDCFAPERDPVTGVRSYATEAARELSESGFIFGCPVAPLILDGIGEGELSVICRNALESWQQMIAARFRAAGLTDVRAASFATLVVSAVEGALLMARALHDSRPLLQVGDELAWQAENLLQREGRHPCNRTKRH